MTPKYAASAVSKKVMDKNSNVCLFALSVAESCMKNCGAKFHEELLTWQFVENLHKLVCLTYSCLQVLTNVIKFFHLQSAFCVITNLLFF